MNLNVDMSEVFGLADDVDAAAKAAGPKAREVIQAGAKEVGDLWRDNARRTAGKHGKLYPATIGYETRLVAGGPVAEVGPVSSRPQGGMGPGFEYGSVNQPPHLDGNRAADVVEPKLAQALAELTYDIL